MKNLLAFIHYLGFIFSGLSLMAQHPTINSVSLSSQQIGLYEKLEVVLDLNASFSNPYNYDEVRVYAEFDNGSQEVKKVDGFYMETYEFLGSNGAIQKSNEDGFYLRFSPNALGNWSFRVFVEDKNGIDSSSWINLNVVNSLQKGFLRSNTSNYLSFDSGEGFIPIGHNIAWPNGSAYANYTSWLSSLKNKGGNYFRLWHCHWGLSIEWLGNGYQGIKNYQQSNAFYLDWLHDYCTANDIYVMLCLQHHGQVSTQVNPNWSGNPYNVANGGMCKNTWDFFSDSMAKADTKNRLRYIVARWGYSPSILAWELFNEVNWTDDFSLYLSDIADWHEEMATYIRELDPNQHLITTSLAENRHGSMFWTFPEMDLSQTHNYLSSPNIERALAQSSRSLLETFDKPTLAGEFGISTSGNNLSQLDPDGIHLHNGLWGGFFGGGLGSPGSWWWDSYIHPRNLYQHYEGFSSITSKIPLYQQKYSPADAYTEGQNADLSMTPSLGWGVLGSDSTEIGNNGQIIRGGSLAEYLYGSDWNTQFRSPPTFLVDFPTQGEFIVHTGSTSGQNPKIAIWLDGSKVLEKNASTNQSYSISVPPGPHTIKVDNTGKDWITINSYTFTDLGSLLDSYVLKSYSKDALTAWVIQSSYNHEEAQAGQLPDTVSGSSLVVPDVQNGFYFAQWFDPLSGNSIGVDSIDVINDTLELLIPPLKWDLALILDQQGPLTAIGESFAASMEFKAYPNPIQGESIYVEGNFPQTNGRAELFNMNGSLIQGWEVQALDWTGKALKLDMKPNLPSGYYWLSVYVGEKVGRKLLVKN